MNFQTLENEINNILSKVPGEYGFALKTSAGTIQFNENTEMPAASTIKIPIMMEAFRQIKTGQLNPAEKVKLAYYQKVGGNGVLKRFSDGVSLPLIDMINLMIVISDNVASNIILHKVGFDNVNQLCEEMGYTHTRIRRCFMDIESQKQGKENTTSAKNMLTILENIDQGGSYKGEMLSILENQEFNHKLAAYNDNDQIKIAHKTGEIPGVEHDVGLFQYNNQKVYVAILLNQLDNQVASQHAISKVGKIIMEYMIGVENV